LNTQPLAATLPRFGIGAEFDSFLYAQIGEEANGMQLSVVSALARQNVDPWEFAQQLSAMQREPAIRILASMLAHIPARASGSATAEDIAAGLVALLPPKRTSAEMPGPLHIDQKDVRPVAMIKGIQLIVVITLFMLFSQLLLAGLYANAPADKPAPPGVSAPAPVGKTTTPVH
jgi:hypothetical protein